MLEKKVSNGFAVSCRLFFSAVAAALIVAPNQSCGSFIKKLDYDLWSHLVKILTIMHHLAISTRYTAALLVQTLSFVTLFSLLIHMYTDMQKRGYFA